MFIGCAVIVLCALGGIGVKAEFNVDVEDISIVYIDPEYFDTEKTEVYVVEHDSSANTISASITFVKELPPETEVHFKLLGLSMGKYDSPTGLEMAMDLCDMMVEPILAGPFLSVLGLDPDICPPKRGTYSQDGYTLAMDNLPDDFPENKYLASYELGFSDKPLIIIKIYADVQEI